MKKLQIWPVIHFQTNEVALRNAAIAARCGCDGVFLIDMAGQDDPMQLDATAAQIKQLHPKLKVGINFLSLRALDALDRNLHLGLDATWTDSPGIRSDGIEATALDIESRLKASSSHLFFASVAFKYQPEDSDPPMAARFARKLGMVPTTSGMKTGQAPSTEKLRAMQQTNIGSALALASGVTPDNVQELGQFLTHVLVSTGISQSFYLFSETLLKQLMANAENAHRQL